MATQICAACIGLVYAFFGICGFIPAFIGLPPDHLPVDMSAINRFDGYIFGWMPSNLLHAIVYLALGAPGLLATANFKTATLYCRGMFAAALMFSVIGLLPLGASDLWGFLPLFGWNVPINTIAAILALNYGLVYPIDLGVGTELIPQ